MHKVQELVRLHRMKHTTREVARLLGISPNTERRWRLLLDDAGLLAGPVDSLPSIPTLDAAVPARIPEQQVSSVLAFQEEISALRSRGAGPKAIYDKLRLDPGFKGSYCAIKRFCRRMTQVEPAKAEDVAIVVDTCPGQVAQVDFGYVGRIRESPGGPFRKAWVFVMVLGHSRHAFARIVFRQDSATWQRLHQEAFNYFGGVPAVVVPDNLKAAVIKSCFGIGNQPTLNRSYISLAQHFGFTIDPAPVRQPQKKGKVERFIDYLKRNFLVTMDEDLDIKQANDALDRWLRQIAGTRQHARTGKRPADMFEKEEKASLLPVPIAPYVVTTWHRAKVHKDSHVIFRRRQYSVPWTSILTEVDLCATPDTVYIYQDHRRLAAHSRRDSHGRSTNESHLPEERISLAHRDADWWRDRADDIGPLTRAWVEEVLESDGRITPLRRVQSALSHLKKFPATRAERTCQRASRYGIFDPAELRDILRKGLDFEEFEPTPQTDQHKAFRFARRTAPVMEVASV